jgi:hypothetical protein
MQQFHESRQLNHALPGFRALASSRRWNCGRLPDPTHALTHYLTGSQYVTFIARKLLPGAWNTSPSAPGPT